MRIETGKMARLAAGAVTVQYADSMVVVATVRDRVREDCDFFPLTIDYREKGYAAGRIFGGRFMKREGRPTQKEILTCRLIDRPLRPLFPDGYREEVQVNAIVLSADRENDPDVLALIGASGSLVVSPIPFLGPVGAVRIGCVDGKLIVNPTHTELETSALDLVVAGTKEAVTMVEAGAAEVSEDVVIEAIELGHGVIKEICAMQEELAAAVPVEKFPISEELLERSRKALSLVKGAYKDQIAATIRIVGKKERTAAMGEVKKKAVAGLIRAGAPGALAPGDVVAACEEVEAELMRRMILDEGRRLDSRSYTGIRPITCEVSLLPRVHGSCLFTRGETQALATVTLGSTNDELWVESLREVASERFMLHYNFPSFCVGEVRPIRGPSRREIGHGELAGRALQVVLPSGDVFPYTIRVVSDVMESNGSSSMATVCGGTMALMDAGVPISAPVAGIAMGLVKEGRKVNILSDIVGDEDHFGDMDFKVAGTAKGITALQMDIKTTGIDTVIMRDALVQAKGGRIEILEKMLAVLGKPREKISEYAPKVFKIKIPVDKIGKLIGPGGKTINGIQAETGAQIGVEDDGTVSIAAVEGAAAEAALRRIELLTAEPEVGRIYTGPVKTVKEFGAFIEILPGVDGLCHISELSDEFVKDIQNFVSVGDELTVKLIDIDNMGRLRLSRKAALKEAQGEGEKGEEAKG